MTGNSKNRKDTSFKSISSTALGHGKKKQPPSSGKEASSSESSSTESSFAHQYQECLKLPGVIEQLKSIFRDGIAEENDLLHGRVAQLEQDLTAARSSIDSLQKDLDDSKSTIAKLTDDLNQAELNITTNRTDLCTLRQYTRRNSLRITNPNWVERVRENTDQLVLNLAWEMGVELYSWQIDRSHRVGKAKAGVPRAILVKFIGYGPRRSLFDAGNRMRMDRYRPRHLKDVYINEDLTT